MLRKLAIAVLVVASVSAGSVTYASSSGHAGLVKALFATARYRNLSTAKGAGYHILLDAAGVACIDMPGMGAMGVHYVRDDFVGDDKVEPTKPEALVYEPDQFGHSRLVALEYVVFKDKWDATHSTPPVLFGQQFNFTDAGNRFGLPPYYSLHTWIWKFNPAGTFAMFNPRVTCTPGAHDHTTMQPMPMPMPMPMPAQASGGGNGGARVR